MPLADTMMHGVFTLLMALDSSHRSGQMKFAHVQRIALAARIDLGELHVVFLAYFRYKSVALSAMGLSTYTGKRGILFCASSSRR